MSKKRASCRSNGRDECNLSDEIRELRQMIKCQNKILKKLITQVQEQQCKDPDEIEETPESTVTCCNPYIKCLNPDFLYHLTLDTESTDFPKTFGDVRFVCLGGTASRMEKFAYFIMKEIGLKMNSGAKLKDFAEGCNRYALFKVGPVLCASHGIGGPSISILLHELIKMMCHAKCQDPVFFRLGTSGGLGVEPGTVVITTQPLDGELRPCQEVVIHGHSVFRDSQLNQELAEELKSLSSDTDGYETVLGKTMCANDFYEGQSRLDGAFCSYTPEAKMTYLQHLRDKGVVNIEMESVVFGALTNQANIRAAVVCVTLLNRLKGDQITTPHEVLHDFDKRPHTLIARYIRKILYSPKEDECE